MNCKRLKTLLLLLILSAIRVSAASEITAKSDSIYQQLYKEYSILFYKDDPESVKRFYAIQKKMEEYHLNNKNLYGYFSIRLGDVFYDNDHKRPFDAIQKANLLFDEMKSRGEDSYFLVYEALGHIFQSRGNYRMAEKYYLDANKNSVNAEKFVKMRIYFRLANLHMIHDPEVARKWNNHCEELSREYPDFRQAYYVVESIINFSLNDADAFKNVYQQYTELRKDHPELDDNGQYIMYVIYQAFKGNYTASLERLKEPTSELNEIERLDLKRLILQRMNNYPEALKVEIKRGALVDSLNTDMLFDNLNKINVEIGVAKMETKAAEDRVLWMAIIMVLLVLVFAALVWRHITRRRMRKQLIKQNQELEIALDRAQESERMKNSFIKHVSHEIRTPLNVITGFAQIISNPTYELQEEERKTMLNEISKKTAEITTIVNELLDVADEESKHHIDKKDRIDVDVFCQKVMNDIKQMNNGRLKLNYINLLDEGFTLLSNQQALEKVVKHLMKNAIKFTEQGSVELKVRERAANGGIEFSITDTGIGISKEDQEKIFERFYKVDSFKQGFGLGLTLCRKNAILLGGNLILDENYTKGARFVLTLPTV